MDERWLGFAGAAAALAIATLLAFPAHWSVEVLVEPVNFEVSATVAGVHIELKL